MSANRCPLCGEEDRVTDLVAHRHYTIKRCRNCGLIYQETSPDFKYLNYDNIYRDQSPWRPPTRPQIKMFKRISDDIRKAHPRRKKVLEIGCSYGLLLSFLRDAGWETTGIDSSRNAVRSARARGLDCRDVSLKDFRPDNQFDVILLIHVLEHLPSPAASLRMILSWLAPGGSIYLRLPNIGSRFVNRTRNNFIAHLKPFEHLYYFTPDTIKRLLEETGYACSIKLASRNTLGDILNSRLRSRLVLNGNWLSYNYERPPETKRLYSLLKGVYEKVILRLLNLVAVGEKDKEIIVTGRRAGEQ